MTIMGRQPQSDHALRAEWYLEAAGRALRLQGGWVYIDMPGGGGLRVRVHQRLAPPAWSELVSAAGPDGISLTYRVLRGLEPVIVTTRTGRFTSDTCAEFGPPDQTVRPR